MQLFATVTILLLTIFAAAAPSQVRIAPLSCSTLAPSNLQIISEIQPDKVYANDLTTFLVLQVEDSNTPTGLADRVYMLAAFKPPADATNLKLVVTFPPDYSGIFNTHLPAGPPLLIVHAILTPGDSSSILPPEYWSWDSIVGGGLDTGPFIGILQIVPDEDKVIGSVIVNVGTGFDVLGYEFRIWLPWETSAITVAELGPGVGIFMQYDC